jgi:anti-sigma regulatory factor (Ser/Thr protein kinase)
MILRQTSADFSLQLGFSPMTLDQIRLKTAGLMEDLGVPQGQRHPVLVVVEELCTNILEHGMANWMEVGICRNGSNVSLAIADNGLHFDPSLQATTAPSSARLEAALNRKLGLYLIGSLTHGFRYTRDDIGVNLVELDLNSEFEQGGKEAP